jgi:transcriptional regulator with XRE-family HTH domain
MILAKKLARQKGMTNADICRKTGMGQPLMSKILNGRIYPYPVQAKRIALALEYEGDIDELFREEA